MEAVIYMITTKDGLYIGSTIDFKMRCYKHKYDLKRGDLTPVYENIRKNNGEYKIEILLDLVCENKTELLQIEEEYRVSCEANLNARPAYTSIEDAFSKNRSSALKSYYKNKASINKKKAEKIDCECGGKHTFGHKSTHYKSLRHQTYLSSL